MLCFLQWLWFGHIHHWNTLDSGTWRCEGDRRPRGKWWEQECDKCGTRRYYQQ